MARSSRSLCSSSLVTPRTMTVSLAPPSCRLADVWVTRAPAAAERLGIFLPPALCALVRLCPIERLLWGVFSSVESLMNAFLNTASQRAQAGISFCLLVIEAVDGGWSDALRSVVSWIASESNRCSPVSRADASFKIAQRISCTLHRENARAILKLAPEKSGSHCCSLGLSLLSESEHD